MIHKWILICFVSGLILYSGSGFAQNTAQKPPFVSNNKSKYKEYKNFHGGAGSVSFMDLYSSDDFGTNIHFIRQGVIPPESSIGEHYMKTADEVYVILEGRALVTVNGKSGYLSVISYVVCPPGQSIGIYNDTKKDVEFMCLGVTMEKRKFETVDYSKDLTKSAGEFPPPFPWAKFDKENSYYLEKVHDGANGMNICDAYGSFSKTNNVGFGICNIPPGSSIGYHQHDTVEEIYCIVSGTGRLTSNDKTYDVKKGDCSPVFLHGRHGIYNNGKEDLNVLVFGCTLEKNVFKSQNLGDDLSTR